MTNHTTGKTVQQLIFEHEQYPEQKVRLTRLRNRVRSYAYRNGAPLPCIQCGALTSPEGDMPPCGH